MTIEFKEYTEEEKRIVELDGFFTGCYDCIFINDPILCKENPCTSNKRDDKKEGYYIQVKD